MKEKIKKIITFNLEQYLIDHLKKIPENNHNIAKEYFYKDMEKISDYCYNNFDNLLSENFIKGFHKSLYPEGYIQKSKDENGIEFIWMIPGEYRNIKVIASEDKSDVYANSNQIENLVKNILSKFSENISKTRTEKEKKDLILLFAVEFVSIHPFGDGNGRMAGLLADLLCLKYDINPLGLLRIYKQNKNDFIESINRAKKENDVSYLYPFINGTI